MLQEDAVMRNGEAADDRVAAWEQVVAHRSLPLRGIGRHTSPAAAGERVCGGEGRGHVVPQDADATGASVLRLKETGPAADRFARRMQILVVAGVGGVGGAGQRTRFG